MVYTLQACMMDYTLELTVLNSTECNTLKFTVIIEGFLDLVHVKTNTMLSPQIIYFCILHYLGFVTYALHSNFLRTSPYASFESGISYTEFSQVASSYYPNPFGACSLNSATQMKTVKTQRNKHLLKASGV